MCKRIILISIYLILLFSIYGESIKCPDGSSYEGTLIDGVFNGYGEQYWNENLYFKGNYVNGKFEGKGLLVNGENTYEGEFSNGEYSGTGILTSNFGYKYVGTFKHNLFNGTGFIVYQNGDSYKGDFKDGYFHGYGTYKHLNGKIDNGIFENGIYFDPLKKIKNVTKIIFILTAIISICANICFLIKIKNRNK